MHTMQEYFELAAIYEKRLQAKNVTDCTRIIKRRYFPGVWSQKYPARTSKKDLFGSPLSCDSFSANFCSISRRQSLAFPTASLYCLWNEIVSCNSCCFSLASFRMVSRLASVEASVVSFQGTVAARSVILARRDSKISTFSLNSCKTISHEHRQLSRCSCYYNLKVLGFFFKKTDSYRFMPGMTVSWPKTWVDLLRVDRGSL